MNEKTKQKTSENSAEKAREEGVTPPKAWTLYGVIQENGELYNTAVEHINTLFESSEAVRRVLTELDYIDGDSDCIRSYQAGVKELQKGMMSFAAGMTEIVKQSQLTKEGKHDHFKGKLRS